MYTFSKSELLKRVTPSVLIAMFMLLMYPITIKYSQSFKFVDEDEHMVIADLLNRGYRLYEDISANHQPFPYLLSATMQKIDRPDNLIMLVRRHRQLVFLWAIAWSLLLSLRFSWKVVPVIIIYESLKYLALGNEFLAESLVIYPLLYVIAYTLWKRKGDKFFDKTESLIFGLVCCLVVTTLLPLAPLIGALMGFQLFIKKNKFSIYIILGFLLGWIVLFSIINPLDYWRETIINNYIFAVPRLNETRDPQDYLKLFFYPFNHTLAPHLLTYWSRLMIFLFGNSLIILWLNKQKRVLRELIGTIAFWTLANLRVIEVDVLFYGAFHLLPWILVITITTLALVYRTWKMATINQKIAVAMSCFIFSTAFGVKSGAPWNVQIDPNLENYIQFTPVTQTGQIISAIQSPEDTFMTFPAEVLNYWINELKPADGQVTHYEWQFYPLRNQHSLKTAMENNLSDIVLFTDDKSAYTISVIPVLDQFFLPIFEFYKGTEKHTLYIKKDKFNSLSDYQKQQLKNAYLTMQSPLPKILMN